MAEIELSRLEVPSDVTVTVERLKEFIHLLPRLGREFSRENLEKRTDVPPKSVIPRVLGYLKYLDIIIEKRVRSEKDSPRDSQQRFVLTEIGKRFYYEVESRREDRFADLWKSHIARHPVYQVTFQHKLENHPTLTLNELQDLVYVAKDKKVSASFARKGAEFLARLYADAKLVTFDEAEERIVLAPQGQEGRTPSDSEQDRPSDQHERGDILQERHIPTTPTSRMVPPTNVFSGVYSSSPPSMPISSGEAEEYRGVGIYIQIVPTKSNLRKARMFLDMVDPGIEDERVEPDEPQESAAQAAAEELS